MASASAIDPEGSVNDRPEEKYGAGPVILRIGNGGGGHTGIIRALSEAYLQQHAPNNGITWTYNLSRNTLLALHNNTIDIALSYDRQSEQIAGSEGWCTIAGPAFQDHFVLAGPTADPLNLRNAPTIYDALRIIYDSGRQGTGLWHSRSDRSATMAKERSLWNVVGVEPWLEEETIDWYRMNYDPPALALLAADPAGAYHLTDRSTLLRQTATGRIKDTTVFLEPTSGDHVLLNSCWACCATRPPSDEVGGRVKHFLGWLMGEDGQRIVKGFGEAEVGVPFFATVADGYCRKGLVGGRAEGKRWVEGGGYSSIDKGVAELKPTSDALT